MNIDNIKGNSNVLEVNKNQLTCFNKMDIEVVPFEYKAKDNENVFEVYIFGDIPIMVKSKTITKEEFNRMIS